MPSARRFRVGPAERARIGTSCSRRAALRSAKAIDSTVTGLSSPPSQLRRRASVFAAWPQTHAWRRRTGHWCEWTFPGQSRACGASGSSPARSCGSSRASSMAVRAHTEPPSKSLRGLHNVHHDKTSATFGRGSRSSGVGTRSASGVSSSGLGGSGSTKRSLSRLNPVIAQKDSAAALASSSLRMASAQASAARTVPANPAAIQGGPGRRLSFANAARSNS